MNQKIVRSFSRWLAAQARAEQFSGVVVVKQGEKVLLRRAYGFANRSWKIKNTPETRFRIASVGKMFTAAAVLQLVEAGKLTLETRAVEYLGLAGTKIPPQVNAYHLLTMTSGIVDWIDEDSETWKEDWARFVREHPVYLLRKDADFLPIFAYSEPYWPAGKKFRYCGAGYMLLGLMIEKAGGLTYFDYVRRNIFARAGMEQSDFLDLDDVSSNVAEGYVPVEGEDGASVGWKKNIYSTTAGPAADGGSTSSAEDLVRFLRSLRAGQLLSSEATRLMLSPLAKDEEDEHPQGHWFYGMGCLILEDGQGRILRWGHTGEEDGVSCRVFYYPQHDLDVVILGNLSDCAGKVLRRLDELVLKL